MKQSKVKVTIEWSSCMAYRLVTNLEIYTVNCGLLFPGKFFFHNGYLSTLFVKARRNLAVLDSASQTASRSLQPFCRTYYCHRPTDRPTDHTTRSVTIGRIYVRSTAMWPKKWFAIHELQRKVYNYKSVFNTICDWLYIGWQWRNFFISAVFPPCCRSSSATCCLRRHHFLCKIALIRTFS